MTRTLIAAVSDVLYILDWHRGVDWALDQLTPETKETSTSNLKARMLMRKCGQTVGALCNRGRYSKPSDL